MSGVTKWVKDHRKLITYVVGAVIVLATQIYGTSNHWVELAILVATGLGVYGVPNTKSGNDTNAPSSN